MKALVRAMERIGLDGRRVDDASHIYRWARVPIQAFPPPFCDMKADDVEDILCTYREVFESWQSQ
jgi:hypothetical protein